MAGGGSAPPPSVGAQVFVFLSYRIVLESDALQKSPIVFVDLLDLPLFATTAGKCSLTLEVGTSQNSATFYFFIFFIYAYDMMCPRKTLAGSLRSKAFWRTGKLAAQCWGRRAGGRDLRFRHTGACFGQELDSVVNPRPTAISPSPFQHASPPKRNKTLCSFRLCA